MRCFCSGSSSFAVVVVSFVAISFLLYEGSMVHELDRTRASKIVGSGDSNWCYSYSSACTGINHDPLCMLITCESPGTTCAAIAVFYNPEECRTDFGNQYCSDRVLTNDVICKKTQNCVCRLRAGNLECDDDILSANYTLVNIFTSSDCSFVVLP
jgi:hypothetical protein